MKKFSKSSIALSLLIAASALGTTGCSTADKYLDSKNPITISIWHYYNGNLKNSFDSMVAEFNETVGLEKGIIVEGHSHGDVTELENAVKNSINKEVGSSDLPDIFASYADTAYIAENAGILADLEEYFSEDELNEYLDSYIEEGRIGKNGELKIFPTAKSTEVFMLNKTDWEPFAAEYNLTYDNLKTKEGVVEVAEKYYRWTDALTPDIPDDGKAFYGRDAMANYFVIGTKQLGKEIFSVENQQVTFNVEDEDMKRLWDCYYVPFINGYFCANGRYRSDDATVGDLIALTGSASSAIYFPPEVTDGMNSHAIESEIMTVPVFEGGENVAVQQGAGMVIIQSTPQREYASAEFLKWFTDTENNILFSASSGYLPVKKEANNLETYSAVCEEKGYEIDALTMSTLKVAFETVNNFELYTNKAFEGGSDARNVINTSLSNKAVADREQVLSLMAEGMSREDAVAKFDTDDNFNSWLAEFKADLEKTTA